MISVLARAIHGGTYTEFTVCVEGDEPISEQEALRRVKRRIMQTDGPKFKFLVESIEIVRMDDPVREPVFSHGIHPLCGLIRA